MAGIRLHHLAASGVAFAAFLPSQANAQTLTSIPNSTPFQTVDQNYIDVTSGNIVLPDLATISAGTVGGKSGYVTQPDLASIDSGIGQSDGIKFSGISQSDSVNRLYSIQHSDEITGLADYNDVGLSYGNSTVHFACTRVNNPVCTPDHADSQALSFDISSNTWTYTNKIGEVHHYIYSNPGLWILNDVISPDGVTQVYAYQQFFDLSTNPVNSLGAPISRVASITSSNGYMLKFSYLDDLSNIGALANPPTPPLGLGYLDGYQNLFKYKSVGIYNLASTYCTPDITPCSSSPLTYLNFTASRPSANIENRTVSDALGRTWSISYYLASPDSVFTLYSPLSVRFPGDSADRITYANNCYNNRCYGTERPSSVNSGGKIWNYTYNFHYLTSVNPNIIDETITNPLGGLKTFTGDGAGNIKSVTDEIGRVTNYTYNSVLPLGKSLLSSVVHPEGNSEQYSYDGRGNMVQKTSVPKPGSGLASVTSTANYPTACTNQKTCNKPNWAADAAGNVTSFTYDPSHGGPLSVLGPPPSAGAASPLRLFTYVQKSAYVLNSTGALVSMGQPKWLPDTLVVCQTVAGSTALVCDPSGPKQTVKYIYGADGTANNLRLRGKEVTSAGVTLRSCFGYDQLGRIISETTPNANLGTCP